MAAVHPSPVAFELLGQEMAAGHLVALRREDDVVRRERVLLQVLGNPVRRRLPPQFLFLRRPRSLRGRLVDPAEELDGPLHRVLVVLEADVEVLEEIRDELPCVREEWLQVGNGVAIRIGRPPLDNPDASLDLLFRQTFQRVRNPFLHGNVLVEPFLRKLGHLQDGLAPTEVLLEHGLVPLRLLREKPDFGGPHAAHVQAIHLHADKLDKLLDDRLEARDALPGGRPCEALKRGGPLTFRHLKQAVELFHLLGRQHTEEKPINPLVRLGSGLPDQVLQDRLARPHDAPLKEPVTGEIGERGQAGDAQGLAREVVEECPAIPLPESPEARVIQGFALVLRKRPRAVGELLEDVRMDAHLPCDVVSDRLRNVVGLPDAPRGLDELVEEGDVEPRRRRVVLDDGGDRAGVECRVPVDLRGVPADFPEGLDRVDPRTRAPGDGNRVGEGLGVLGIQRCMQAILACFLSQYHAVLGEVRRARHGGHGPQVVTVKKRRQRGAGSGQTILKDRSRRGTV